MYIFKTAGATFDSVIANQKHAFRNSPKDWQRGEIVLVSKNRTDCMPHEKQIQFIMRIDKIREAKDEEILSYWPGNSGRWNYLIDCYGTEAIPDPFNLDEILGEESKRYKSIFTFGKLLGKHEAQIIPYLSLSTKNNV